MAMHNNVQRLVLLNFILYFCPGPLFILVSLLNGPTWLKQVYITLHRQIEQRKKDSFVIRTQQRLCHCSLRSKRFRAVGEQRKTSLLFSNTETLATQTNFHDFHLIRKQTQHLKINLRTPLNSSGWSLDSNRERSFKL